MAKRPIEAVVVPQLTRLSRIYGAGELAALMLGWCVRILRDDGEDLEDVITMMREHDAEQKKDGN